MDFSDSTEYSHTIMTTSAATATASVAAATGAAASTTTVVTLFFLLLVSGAFVRRCVGASVWISEEFRRCREIVSS